MTNQFLVRIAPDFEERYPNASATATECAMNLVYTTDLLVKRISALLQPFDLSPGSGLVLSLLADSPEPLPPHVLAEHLIISRASVTSLVDSLERRGYVRRLPHPTDRRGILVELTETGRRVANEFRPLVHQHQKMWLEVLSVGEQKQLINSLQKLQKTLSERE